MASKKKGTSGGNAKPDTRGSVTDNIKLTEVGRARKRAIQRARDQAAHTARQAEAAQLAAEQAVKMAERHEEFELLFGSAPGNPQLLVSGEVGSLVGLSLEKFDGEELVASGRVVVQIVTDRHGDPAATVIASEFVPLPVFEGGLHLPLRTLRYHKLQQILPDRLHALQLELWHALKWVCRRELRKEAKLFGRHTEQQAA